MQKRILLYIRFLLCIIVLSFQLQGSGKSIYGGQLICGGINIGFDKQNHPVAITEKNFYLLKAQSLIGSSDFMDNTQITVITDSSTSGFAFYIDTLVSELLPLIEGVYGFPFTSVTVTVTYDSTQYPWFYYNALDHEIVISCRPGEASGSSYPVNPYQHDDDGDGYTDEDPFDGIDNDEDGLTDEDLDNDPLWDGVFTHELIHAFHTGIWLKIVWVEEGMTECAAQLVTEIMQHEYIRKMSRPKPANTIPFYDSWNNMGKDIVNVVDFPVYKILPDMWYYSSSALFWILMLSQSEGVIAGDWRQLDYLKKLNEIFCNPVILVWEELWPEQVIAKMSSVSTRPIDGLAFLEWLQYQNICYGSIYTTVEAGMYLGIYTYGNSFDGQFFWGVTNPEIFNVFGFTRSDNDPYEQVITGQDIVDIRIYNSSGVEVWNSNSMDVILSDSAGYNEYEIGKTQLWEKGAYRITADVVVDGIDSLHAQNFFLVTGPIGSVEDIFNSAEQGLGLISLNREKELSVDTLYSPDGHFDINKNGAAVLVVDDLILSNLSVNIQRNSLIQNFSVPNPFTRIVSLYSRDAGGGKLLSGWPRSVVSANASAIASIGVEDINMNSMKEIIAWVNHLGLPPGITGSSNSDGGVWVYSTDGNIMSGWPYYIDHHAGQVYFTNLDGIGVKEILLKPYSWGGDYLVFKSTGEQYEWTIDVESSGPTSNLLFLDINSENPGNEILIGTDNYQKDLLYAFNNDGSLIPGFPLEFEDPAEEGIVRIQGGDFDGDSDNEIMIVQARGENNSQALYLYILDKNGEVQTGWPQRLGYRYISSTIYQDFGQVFPIGDVNRDGAAEIVCTTAKNTSDLGSPGGQIAVYKLDGTILSGWPFQFEKADYIEAIIADLNRDHLLEIIAYVEIHDYNAGYFNQSLYVFDSYGNVLTGWPKNNIGLIESIISGNVDEDIDAEIILSGAGIYLWNLDGTDVQGSPYSRIQTGYTVQRNFSNPVLCDFNNDGKTNLVTLSEFDLYVWDLEVDHNESLMDWPMSGHDNDQTGFYRAEQINPQEVFENSLLCKEFKLSQNYPNPFNSTTCINYQIPRNSHIEISVYNLLGQKVAELFKGVKNAGFYKITWDAANISSGLYFIKMNSNSFENVRKCLILK